LDPRARRLLRRVPRTTVYSALELVLLSLLALQCARLLWAMVTPVDPVGAWQTSAALRPVAQSTALLGTFDPFFRLSGAGPTVVTSLNLKLFGVREDRATGRGSAIIALPDGQQRSFAVGEEIIPGVKLAAVTFDGVTVDRGGTMEQLFLDQSQSAQVVGGVTQPQVAQMAPTDPRAMRPDVIAPPGVIVTPAPSPSPTTVGTQFQPRLQGGRVTGVTVDGAGPSADALRAAGLQQGDVILSVNGQRISSPDQARALAGQVGGGEVSLQIQRGGRTIPLRVKGQQ
jgi:general secretion pathway protein C